jgi:hypothetical protein
MKKLIFIVLLLSPTIGWSEGITKLSCDMKITKKYHDGFSETLKYVEVFDIEENKDFILISPTSDNLHFVSNRESPEKSVLDSSNSTKWNITNLSRYTKTDKTKITLTVTISIDRNTGKVWYSSRYDHVGISSLETTGTGDCEKVDLTKKKF